MTHNLARLLEFRSARRAGRRDGEAGIPSPDEDRTHPFELLALRERAEEQIAGIHREWLEEDEGLRT